MDNHQILHEAAVFMKIEKEMVAELKLIRKLLERAEQREKDKQRRL